MNDSEHSTSTPPPSEDERAARLLEAGLSDTEGTPSPAHVPPSAEELATVFPELEILELLGQGGMGVVYKARQRRLDRLVALKVLPRELGDDPAFAERFGREARTLARLDHPNIVRIHEFGEQGGLYHLVLEYVDGASLRQVMEGGRLQPAEALAIVPPICDALQYAHDQGVVHRDVKPENILLDERGRVKIADFGLAKLTETEPQDPTLTGTRQVMGTWQYMAPEQYRTPQAVDHRADIYSLGVVFYEMLTGDLPVGRYRQPSEALDVDARIDEIVMRTLEREREQRYQRAAEVGEDVEHVQDGDASSPPREPESTTAPANPPHRRGRAPLVLGGIALPFGLAVGLVTFLFVRNGLDQTVEEAGDAAAVLATIVWSFGLILSIVGGEHAARRGFGRSAWIVAAIFAALNAGAIPLGWAWAGSEARAWKSRLYLRRHGVDEPPPVRVAEPTELDRLLDGSLRPQVYGTQDLNLQQEVMVGILRAWTRWRDLVQDRDLEFEEAIDLYAVRDGSALRRQPAEEVLDRAARGELGLPLVGVVTLGAPARHFRVSRIEIGRYERTARVQLDKRRAPFDRCFEFTMRIDGGAWAFTADPVKRVR